MRLIPRWTLLLYACSLFVGFAIFLRGFLAIKVPLYGHATWDALTLEPGLENAGVGSAFPAQFDRLVLVLVDALRADFVLPTGNPNLPRMEFVKGLISENKTLSFLAKAHPPTVTLPRIKALTTGDVPGFVDVVLNFDSAALQEDNLISQFHRHDKRLVFYGDDTWMRLFPQHFLREDGTTSFFVSDYTEVDNNVTRHLDYELDAEDWEVLILHYLGLDHIGHLAGPYSPLVSPKLQEMDDIIKKLYHTLLEKDAASGRSSLLVLCGDHGMSDQGSHGGSSVQEVNTPFILMSSKWATGTGSPFTDQAVNQVDLVPTLSLLFGLPIPRNSLGVVILPALQAYSTRHQMAALHVNAQQLLNVFKHNLADDYEREPSYQALQRALAAHSAWLAGGRVAPRAETVRTRYTEALRAMRERLSESLITYDLHAMAVGMALLSMVCVSLLLSTLSSPVATTFSSSGILVPGLLCVVCIGGHVTVCTGPHASPLLCASGSLAGLLSGCSLLLAAGCLAQICKLVPSLQLTKSGVWRWRGGVCGGFLLAGTAGHTLSLTASSFVEEEHQTWYLLTTSAELLLMAHLVTCSTGSQSPDTDGFTEERPAVARSTLEEEYLQVQEISAMHMRCFDNTKRTTRGAGDKAHEEPNAPGSHLSHQVAALVTALIAGRVARAWNRTGDKWSHLPDVGDWLVDEAHKMSLSAAVVASLCGVCAVRWRRGVTWSTSNLLVGGAAGVYCFRSANGALYMPVMYGETADRYIGMSSLRLGVPPGSQLGKTHSGDSKFPASLRLGVPVQPVSDWRGILEARVVYSILCTLLVATFLHYWNSPAADDNEISRQKNSRQNNRKHKSSQRAPEGSRRTVLLAHARLAWTLLMLLLVRPHNIPLVFLVTVMEECLSTALRHAHTVPTWATTLLFLWMGQACFFYQGNSNSISTVDVSAGYIGLEEFSPGLVTFLMCLSTYAGPVFWILSLLRFLSDKADRKSSKDARWQDVLDEVSFVLLSARALPLAVYTCLTTAQRYHLFVWTVFSPKLLYEGMLTVVTSVTLFVIQPLYYL